MKYTLFLGCNIPARVQQYQLSAKAICDHLDIELAPVKEFMCCGYPMRSIDEFVFLLSAARNLAMAENRNEDLMVLCKCCYGNLKTAQFHLKENTSLQEKINKILKKENLTYKGNIKVKHFLSVLHKDIGINKLKSCIKTKYKKLNIAASVGCHALRPGNITQFDTPATPTVFDDLVKLTGAKAIDWSKKSECCGAPLLGINDDLSQHIMEKKLSDARQNGADFITVACPYSFLQFDNFQYQIAQKNGDWQILAPVLYSQLLGLSMGISPMRLGFAENQININSLTSYLSKEDTKTNARENSHD
ncbi:MAG: CoB--CoM heterodisulfide reductase iron-sulfur subunit B family protein [Desulfobacula sp.]|nr:CoB--CoM heterodisulfide reductase iron-sulfur subunit B family protein [Desulfobacula sp.]